MTKGSQLPGMFVLGQVVGRRTRGFRPVEAGLGLSARADRAAPFHKFAEAADDPFGNVSGGRNLAGCGAPAEAGGSQDWLPHRAA